MLVSEALLISLLGKAHDEVFTLGLPSALVFGQEKDPRPSVPRIAIARSRLVLQKRKRDKGVRQACGVKGPCYQTQNQLTWSHCGGEETGPEEGRSCLSTMLGQWEG